MSLFVSQLFNGLQTGSVYALVALGYSMVYGIILLLNFAHGDIIMIGAYTAFYAMTAFHLHPIFSVVLAVITSTLLGVVIEKVAYTPLRSAPRLSLLITAIGISFLLENGAQLLFGADTKSMDTLVPGNVTFGTGHGQLYRNFNDYRRSHRDGCPDASCPEDEARQGNACGLRGYGRGAADGHQPEQNHFLHLCQSARRLPVSARFCICAPTQQASPTMGSMLGLKAFVAAVLGGIGSIPGAMVGGFAIGLLEALVCGGRSFRVEGRGCVRNPHCCAACEAVRHHGSSGQRKRSDGGGNEMKTRSKIRIPMPARYVINLCAGGRLSASC